MSSPSILLKVLGSFYSETRKSDLIKAIDSIYSREVMERMATIFLRKLESGDKKIPNAPRFGVVKWEGFNPKTNEITILTPLGKIVDMDKVNYVSFPYIDDGLFFKVNQSVIPKECVDVMSRLKSSSYPLIYMENLETNIDIVGLDNSVLDGVEGLNVQRNVLKSLSSLSIYRGESLNILSVIANAMCGAIYTVGTGEVTSITSDEIITTEGDYSYSVDKNGEVNVSVGDSFSGPTLLTKSIDVVLTDNPLPNREAILGRMNTFHRSKSNEMYLNRISSLLSKRKVKLVIGMNSFLVIQGDGLNAILDSLSSSVSTVIIPETSLSENPVGNLRSYCNGVYDDRVLCTPSIVESLKVDLIEESVVEIDKKDDIKIVKEELVESQSDMLIGMDDLKISEIASIVDDAVGNIDYDSFILYEESHRYIGKKRDDIISNIEPIETLKVSDDISSDVEDDGAIFTDGNVMIDDNAIYRESVLSTIEASVFSDVAIREMEKRTMQFDEVVSSKQEYIVSTTVAQYDTGTIFTSEEKKIASESVLLSDYKRGKTVFLKDSFRNKESIFSDGSLIGKVNSFTFDEIGEVTTSVNDTVIGIDASDISSENTIDEY